MTSRKWIAPWALLGLMVGTVSVFALPMTENDMLTTLRDRFTQATLPEPGAEAKLRGVEENWNCSQYFLFKNAFFEVPNQPIRKFYGTLYTSQDISRLRVASDGDIIGEWGVSEAKGGQAPIFPAALTELKRVAQNQHGITLSDHPELAGVKSVADPLHPVLFYIYCPKPR